MILFCCMAGVLCGLLSGGRPRHILQAHFAHWPMLLLSLCCEWLLASLWLQEVLPDGETHLTVRLALALAQYLLVGFFLFQNRQKAGMIAVLTGSAMNGMVIVANGGRMPIGSAILRYGDSAAKRIPDAPHYFLAQGHEPLLWAADLIPLYPYMVSIGDLAIGLGMFMLGIWLTKAKPESFFPEKKLKKRSTFDILRSGKKTSEKRM
ncbi:MAG: DUF5317 domain-containing protein [Ruminococcaceae bacterium]|nr:DUF5317 domain-containing protein [Oscillospiraceae bacterium]